MPFISKDWRSPGEEWVKYEGGWEKKSVLPMTADSTKNDHLDLWSNLDTGLATVKSRRKNMSECNKENEEVNRMRQKFLLEDHMKRVRRWTENINQRPMCNNRTYNNHSNTFFRLDPGGHGVAVPYCPITVKSTREIVGFNGLAEALLRLDFIRAVSDIRRFHYVSQLMYLLLAHDKLSQLPGAAQKILFRMLEEMASTVFKSNTNEHVFRKLMDELQTTMTIYRVWGSHLGSSQLFKQHLESRRRITEFVEKMQVEYKQDLATPSSPGLVNALPEECIREILLRLSDPGDLERASKTCETMKSVVSEKRVWRELVQTHFTKIQIEFILQEKPDLRDSKDWKELYGALRRKYGIREEFTEMLMLCRKCCALFWKSLGHPCFILETSSDADDSDSDLDQDRLKEGELIPVTPASFLTFFSV